MTQTRSAPVEADAALEAYPNRGFLRRFAPEREAQYQGFLDAALRGRIPWAMGAAAAVLSSYVVLDLYLIPREILSQVLVLRLAMMVLPTLLLLALTTRDTSGRWLHGWVAATCLCVGTGGIAIISLSRRWGMPVDYEGILLVLMYLYGCGAMRFGIAVACGTTLCLAYPLAELWAGLPPEQLATRTMFIVTTNVIGIVTAWILDQELRRNFLVTLQLRKVARQDSLTGLLNRRALDEGMARLWQQAGQAQTPLAVALVDVDWFKAYNDHYGHPGGDRVLRSVARVLAAHARGSGDLVSRYGGEEFVCVWSGRTLDQVERILHRIHADIAALGIAHAGSPEPESQLSVSIGVRVLVPDGRHTPASALQQADQALYQAKASGRRTTVVSR